MGLRVVILVRRDGGKTCEIFVRLKEWRIWYGVLVKKYYLLMLLFIENKISLSPWCVVCNANFEDTIQLCGVAKMLGKFGRKLIFILLWKFGLKFLSLTCFSGLEDNILLKILLSFSIWHRLCGEIEITLCMENMIEILQHSLNWTKCFEINLLSLTKRIWVIRNGVLQQVAISKLMLMGLLMKGKVWWEYEWLLGEWMVFLWLLCPFFWGVVFS